MSRRTRTRLQAIGVVLLLVLRVERLDAQERVTVGADLRFYGDNTEFFNPFRLGETLFGAAGRLEATVSLGDRVEMRLGVMGHHRFGSEEAFELVRPVVALSLQSGGSTFIFGTLPPPRAESGPDRGGPHGLLPPIQHDALAFERPYEAGLQWTLGARRFRHETWLNWQRLNTPEHRERFDAGVNARVGVRGPFALGLQAHVVHHGGQLHESGSVSDSAAYAAGLVVERAIGTLEGATMEVWGLVARHTPDRALPRTSREGAALFVRVAGERAGWRAHVIVWRGSDFVKDEGDTNYHSVRLDGSRYRGTRDYSEAGLARAFRPAHGVTLEGSARLHRVERDYEYSFRLLATTSFGWRVR